MYYQVLIETNEKEGTSRNGRKFFELDKTNLLEIEEDIVIPYLKKQKLHFDGYFLNATDIVRLVIKETDNTTKYYSEYENRNLSSGVIMYISPEDILDFNYAKDITKSIFSTAREKINKDTILMKEIETPDLTKVFIVHGHDELAKTEVARFIEKMGLDAIILHEQVSSGYTIIEKIEEFSNVGFGVILYTSCDLGYKKDDATNIQARARQNVVFEHGYFIAKLGRRNVCALVKGKIEIPNDISGVVYIPMDDHRAWNIALAKELRKAGYKVDMNKII